MKWLVLIVFLAANAALVLLALGPSLVTYVPTAPADITCSLCNTPEVQQALAAATDYGRSSVLTQITSSAVWLLALAAFNVVVVGLLLFARRSKV